MPRSSWIVIVAAALGCAPAAPLEAGGFPDASAAAGAANGGAGSGGAAGQSGAGQSGVTASAGREGNGGVAGATPNGAGGGQGGTLGSAGAGASASASGSGGASGAGNGSGGAAGGSSGTPGAHGGSGGFGDAMAGAGGSAGQGGGGGAPAAYEPCPALPEPCKIMPSGDSITVGAQSTDTGGYRVPLFHSTFQNGKAITFVGPSGAGPATVDGVPFPDAHDGHSGYFIDTIDTRKGLLPLLAGNLTKHSPHVVLLMIGTNDINAQLQLAAAPDRLARMLDLVTETAPSTLLVVAKLVPTRTDALNEDVRSYNEAVAALVAERVAAGKHLLLVDMYGAFTENPSYKDELLFDGLHPNDAGYAVMAEVWYEAIAPFLR